MKILILANNDVGLYKFRKDLIQKLIQQKHHIIISLPYGENISRLTELGCVFIDTPVDRRGMNLLKDYRLFRNYRKIIKEQKPDLVITYTIKPNIYGGIAAIRSKTSYVMNITGLGSVFQKENLIKKAVVLLYKLACRRVKVVFFENAGNQRAFVEAGIVSREKTYKLNGAGVDVQEYSYESYPKENGIIRFLYLGRIMREKGIEEVLGAFLKLKKKYKVELDIVGGYEEEYENQIEKLASKGYINYYGFQEDVKPFIRRCHCMILPSYHEGMANTLLEAGSMGRPLITSNVYGCKEAVNGKNGMIVKCKDVKDLYNKMEKFVRLPYERKKAMGMESHKYISEKFSKEKVVRDTVDKIFAKGM